VLPTGDISQHFIMHFNYLELTFDLSAGLVDNAIDGEVIFAYPLNRIRPYVSFVQKVDFENYLDPQVSGEDLTILPTDKYIFRERGITAGVGITILPRFFVEPAFSVRDTFRGSLTESRVLDQGVNLVPRVSLVYDGVTAYTPGGSLYFTGMYAGSTFSMRYRTDFDQPVDARSENLLLLHQNIRGQWFFKERLSLDLPLNVWDQERTGFYSLGGFDTVRGYEPDAISAFRFLLVYTEIERELWAEGELRLRIRKAVARVHQYRVGLFADTLLAQDTLDTGSPVQAYASAGAGFSFTISGRSNNHFRVRLYIGQPLGERFAPILYFRTSLFGFDQKL
jgi:hypothetical protein